MISLVVRLLSGRRFVRDVRHGVLGLVLNAAVLWTTHYMDAAVAHLCADSLTQGWSPDR